MLALLVAASAMTLVPASADAALVVEDAAGLRQFVEKAGTYAPTLGPDAAGRWLRNSVGIDVLSPPPFVGAGPRVLVFQRGTTGLSAPIKDAKTARALLATWLHGHPKRSGRVAGRRLITASGANAAALAGDLAHPKPPTHDRALLALARGPAWVWLRGDAPLREAVFQIAAAGDGLTARGLVTAAAALLEGSAPPPCPGSPVGCLRVAAGPAGRAVLGRFRLEGNRFALAAIDARALAGDDSLPAALRVVSEQVAAEPRAAALDGELDVGAVLTALERLSPIDALRGSLAAGAYATGLLYKTLLRHAGPLTTSGNPAEAGAQIELRLPLK